MSNDTVEPEVKRFFIEFQKVGTNSCLIVDYGEPGSVVEAFGEQKTCLQLFPDIKHTVMGNISSQLDVSRHYEKPRDYRLKFFAANQISSQNKELMITVIG